MIKILNNLSVKKVLKPWGYEIWWAETGKYAAKFIHINPNQRMSLQYHKNKEETFHVLWGEGSLVVNDKPYSLHAGVVHTILPNQRHYFDSKSGIIIEEISSTHFVDDSFYTDKKIIKNKDRKTLLSHWRIS